MILLLTKRNENLWLRVQVCNLNPTVFLSALLTARRFYTIKIRVQVANLNPPEVIVKRLTQRAGAYKQYAPANRTSVPACHHNVRRGLWPIGWNLEIPVPLRSQCRDALPGRLYPLGTSRYISGDFRTVLSYKVGTDKRSLSMPPVFYCYTCLSYCRLEACATLFCR